MGKPLVNTPPGTLIAGNERLAASRRFVPGVEFVGTFAVGVVVGRVEQKIELLVRHHPQDRKPPPARHAQSDLSR